jgi:hypothetical protein
VHYEVEATLDNPSQGNADRAAASGGGGGGGGAGFADGDGSGLNTSGFAHDAEDEEAELAAAIEVRRRLLLLLLLFYFMCVLSDEQRSFAKTGSGRISQERRKLTTKSGAVSARTPCGLHPR